MEPEPLPPRSCPGIERCDDDGATGRLLVEFDGGGEDVSREGGSDSESDVTAVDGKLAEEERWHRIRCAFRQSLGRGGSIDPVIAMFA
jgi:hypothetical protein